MKLDLWKVVPGLALLSPALAGCRATYSAKTITAHVIDAETKQPLEPLPHPGDPGLKVAEFPKRLSQVNDLIDPLLPLPADPFRSHR